MLKLCPVMTASLNLQLTKKTHLVDYHPNISFKITVRPFDYVTVKAV
jgi:hypothetical protein